MIHTMFRLCSGSLVALLLCQASPLHAQPHYVIPASSVAPDHRSAEYRPLEQQAITLWKTGQTTAANELLAGKLSTLAPAERASAKLRLAYQCDSLRRKQDARRLFAEVAQIPKGTNDAARGEAAVRLVHIVSHEPGTQELCERILAGEYVVSHSDACAAAFHLGAIHHRAKKHKRSIEVYEAVIVSSADVAVQAKALCELAGLWHELANKGGVGNDNRITAGEVPSAWQKAREYCVKVQNLGPQAPRNRRMVADLMLAETYFFERNYEQSYNSTAAFLSKWGDDASAYPPASAERRYVHTGVGLQLQNCYLTGRTDEALSLAENATRSKPRADERFERADPYIYGAVIGKLAATEKGQSTLASSFEQLGKMCDEPYFASLETSLRADRKR